MPVDLPSGWKEGSCRRQRVSRKKQRRGWGCSWCPECPRLQSTSQGPSPRQRASAIPHASFQEKTKAQSSDCTGRRPHSSSSMAMHEGRTQTPLPHPSTPSFPPGERVRARCPTPTTGGGRLPRPYLGVGTDHKILLLTNCAAVAEPLNLFMCLCFLICRATIIIVMSFLKTGMLQELQK